MPLSEEEQKILQEMERKLREHDRGFVERVSHRSERLQGGSSTRWSVCAFVAGAVLLIVGFRSSIALGTVGILVMVVSALFFARRFGPPAPRPPGSVERTARDRRNGGIAEEWSEVRRRMRSRFGHHD